MKKLKRIAALLLTFCLLAAMLPTTVLADQMLVASGNISNTMRWELTARSTGLELEDYTLTISGTGEMDTSYVPWYDYISMIEHIVIENGVTVIGFYAFNGLSNVTSISLSDTVTTIGYGAFTHCTSLKEITIPDSVTTIGQFSFANCAALTQIRIPDGVSKIDLAAFQDCSALTRVEICGDETQIESQAFCGCTNLVDITLPAGLTKIGGLTFCDCKSLTEITIPEGVTTIGFEAFSGCGLTAITIPNSVTSIDYNAFGNCTNLREINIPASVTNLGMPVFDGCSALTGIYVDEGNTAYSSDSAGVLFDKEKTTLLQAPCGLSGSYVIPDSVTTVYDHAFSGCTNLTGITIPASVTNLGTDVFKGCTGLNSFNVDEANTVYSSDSAGALLDKTQTTLLQVPGGLNEIYTVPDSVTTIGKYAFSGCENLNYNIYDNAKYLGTDANPYAFLVAKTGIDISSCEIHPDTKIICSEAFASCGSLTEVIIPDGVTQIGEYAFNGSGITSVTVPNSITAIGKYAFASSYRLNSLIISDGVTSIGDYAFSGCGELQNVEIPDSVTNIGEGAFSNCNYLRNITLPAGITHISSRMLSGCTNLSNVTIPDGVTTIGNWAFMDCFMLNSITIPVSVTSIGTGAFAYCFGLWTVYYEGSTRKWETAEIEIGADNDYFNAAQVECLGPCEHIVLEDGVCLDCGQYVCADIVDEKGNIVASYENFWDALYDATSGQTVRLRTDGYEGFVELPSGVNLDLNGHVMDLAAILTYSSSMILDSSEDNSGCLYIRDNYGNMISKNNSQLPVYDSEANGYRFFDIDVESCAVTGGNKYWFKVNAEKFAPLYDLICADAEVQIKVKMTWDGQTEDTYAAADLSFTKTWADSYNANEDIYITVSVTEAEGLENFKLIPMITSAGVEITGEEL